MGVAVLLGVAPRHAVLHSAPLPSAVVTAEEAPGARYVVAVLAARVVVDVVHVQVVDALAGVHPCLAPVLAAHDAAVLQRQQNEVGVFRMDEDVAHVRELHAHVRSRDAPLVLHLLGHLLQAFQVLPGVAPVLAAHELHRTESGIDHAVVVRIHRKAAGVAFDDPLPALSRVVTAVGAVEGHGGKDALGPGPAGCQSVHGLSGKMLGAHLQPTAAVLVDGEPAVERHVIAE